MGITDFDGYLEKEKEKVKREVKIKQSRHQKSSDIKSSKQLRDNAGFKLKVVETTANKNKQSDPEYEVIIDGTLRKIKPYYFTYKTFCKERWRDRRLLDIFVTEFRDREEDYYRKTIAAGLVYVNNEPANLETIVRNGDLITHKLHRHEPPVSSRPIKIVFENEDILVIDKPSSLPVHPTGRFRFNTITKILERENGYIVHPCNRLDRPTSGLMFLAKTPRGADSMADQLKAREVSKEYVARVKGEFPTEEVIVEQPLRSVEPKVALNAVCSMEDPGAKHAKTVFKRISYDGQTSIVNCKPLTGRTHQIRVHLQYLGYPIANDTIYSNPKIWGTTLGKGGDADFSSVIKELDKVGKTECAESWFYPCLLYTSRCV